MVLKIRLARFGRRRAPFYNIVVAQARTARNSKPLEVLGTYDPIPKAPIDGEGKPFKDIKLDSARAKYWLGVGAQPSDPAWRLLSMVSAVLLLGMVELKVGRKGMRRMELVERKKGKGGWRIGRRKEWKRKRYANTMDIGWITGTQIPAQSCRGKVNRQLKSAREHQDHGTDRSRWCV